MSGGISSEAYQFVEIVAVKVKDTVNLLNKMIFTHKILLFLTSTLQ